MLRNPRLGGIPVLVLKSLTSSLRPTSPPLKLSSCSRMFSNPSTSHLSKRSIHGYATQPPTQNRAFLEWVKRTVLPTKQPWRGIVAAIGLSGLAYMNYITYLYVFHSSDKRPPVDGSGTFETRFKSRSGDRVDKWTKISLQDAEREIRREEKSMVVNRKRNVVTRYDTSQLRSNAPMEDRHAEEIMAGPNGDLNFFAVFDGHSGHATSELLSKTLIPFVALSLSTVFQGHLPPDHDSKWYSKFYYSLTGKTALLSSIPEVVMSSLKHTFISVDRSIVWDPVLLMNSLGPGELPPPTALSTLSPALSGSCALLTYIDCSNDDLYVALVGDCRAVAGYWVADALKDDKEEGEWRDEKGVWRVEVLTEDQTGRSNKEIARMQSEHPKSEAGDVIRNGRVLGGLEPSRAFGDARYKWPANLQKQLYDTLLKPDEPRRNPPPLLKTPPYVTASPVVIHKKIKGGNSKKNGELKFIVLATDGLYDRLSNEEIVGLVGSHLRNPNTKALVPRSRVLKSVLSTTGGVDGKAGKSSLQKYQIKDDFIFGAESNLATHLIRNSLAGADNDKFRELVSVNDGKVSRWMRDDMTVTVVLFGE